MTQMMALVTDQGTAIAGTGLCSVCFTPDRARDILRDGPDDVDTSRGFTSCTGNEQIDCSHCGRRGATMDFAVPYDETVEVVSDIPTAVRTEMDYEDGNDPVGRNTHRAYRSREALVGYAERWEGSAEQEVPIVMGDILSDFLHLCDMLELNFDEVLRQARNRYDEEVDGE